MCELHLLIIKTNLFYVGTIKLIRSTDLRDFTARSYIAYEWGPAIKEAYFNAELVEEYYKDASSLQKTTGKKQVLQLKECLELFTAVDS